MTAVADLESLMSVGVIDTVRGGGCGWYRRTGVWTLVCPGKENMGWGCRLYIPSEHGTREAGTIVVIRSGVSIRCSPGY